MTALIDPIPVFDLPLSMGNDIDLEFVYKVVELDDDDNPVVIDGQTQYVDEDYPDGAVVQLEIDDHPLQRIFIADIDGSIASINVDYKVTDVIRPGLVWRLKVIYEDGLDKVGAQGVTTRDEGDGKG